MESTNCFALKDKKCTVLAVGKCKSRCGFYKTEAELEAGRAAANRRIASLPLADECRIAFAYYSGATPWKLRVKK